MRKDRGLQGGMNTRFCIKEGSRRGGRRLRRMSGWRERCLREKRERGKLKRRRKRAIRKGKEIDTCT